VAILQADVNAPDRWLVKNETQSVFFGAIDRVGDEWFNTPVSGGAPYGLHVPRGPFPTRDAAFAEFQRALADVNGNADPSEPIRKIET